MDLRRLLAALDQGPRELRERPMTDSWFAIGESSPVKLRHSLTKSIRICGPTRMRAQQARYKQTGRPQQLIKDIQGRVMQGRISHLWRHGSCKKRHAAPPAGNPRSLNPRK